MFHKMNTDTKRAIVDSFKCEKIDYNSRKFKQGLERITQENLELMNAKIPDSSKMHLTFNPIYINKHNSSTSDSNKIKNYFQNIYETIKNIYQKV